MTDTDEHRGTEMTNAELIATTRDNIPVLNRIWWENRIRDLCDRLEAADAHAAEVANHLKALTARAAPTYRPYVPCVHCGLPNRGRAPNEGG